MDPIDRHPCSFFPHIEVPYICDHLPVCTGAEFVSWAGLRDWRFRTETQSLEEFAAQLQARLYFGLLSAFVLGSLKIQDRLRTWQERFREHRDKKLTEVSNVLFLAYEAMNRFVLAYLLEQDRETAKDQRGEPSERKLFMETSYVVIFAIDVLIDMLEATLNTFPYRLGIKDGRRCCLVSNVPAFRDPIAITGRCKSLAWRLQPTSTEWYCLLSLPPVGQLLDHEKYCTEQTCFHHGKKTPTLHREDCAAGDSCRSLSPNDHIVQQCILEDKIPLISCTTGQNGKLRIETVTGSLCSEYTAISHVWAGGLGNEVDNSLPECQLEFLMSIVERLPRTRMRSFKEGLGSTWRESADDIAQVVDTLVSRWRKPRFLFWIDTLCIPVAKGKPNEKELAVYKSRAIASTAQLYAGAKNILVLDPELQSIPNSLIQDNKKFLVSFIKSSAWMGRSWTLQEGALAENLFYRLEDRSVQISELSSRVINLPTVRMLDFDPEKLKKHYYWKYWLPSKFSDVWNGLINRSTGQPKDVPAIFAAMVNLSADEILGVGQQRSKITTSSMEMVQEMQMKAIIRAQVKIPLQIFYQHGFNHNGAWSPQLPGSRLKNTSINEFYGTLQVTEEGLLLKEGAPWDTFPLVAEGLPLLDRYTLQLQDTAVMYRIHSEPVKQEAPKYEPHSNSLFMLSKLCCGGSPMYQGARFSIMQRKGKRITLKFDAAIAWAYVPLGEAVGTIDGKCEELLQFWQDTDFEALIDVDINDGTWYMPQWHRTTIFPFSTIGINYGYAWWLASKLSLFLTWTIISNVRYLFHADFSFKSYWQNYRYVQHWDNIRWDVWKFWSRMDTTEKVFLVSLYLRNTTLEIERAFWLKWLTAFARQRWAASFYTSSVLSKKLLSSPHEPMLMVFKTHVTYFAISFLLMIMWLMTRHEWMITVATSLFVEPFVTTLFQLGSYRYSMGIAHFWSAEGKSPLWIVRCFFFLCSLSPIVAIVDGYRKEKPWMVWSGGVVFSFYLLFVWLYFYKGYLEVWCDKIWPPSTDDDDELGYLSHFLMKI